MSKKQLLMTLLLVMPVLGLATPRVQQLLQLIDYVGVDYRGAVAHGQVLDPGEYREMQDFTAAIEAQVAALGGDAGKELRSGAADLTRLVEAKADGAQVAALGQRLRQEIVRRFDVVVVPREAPDLGQAKTLFAEQCAGCHGVKGAGNGVAAVSLNPAPTNFLDRDRYRERSLFGLYATITQGVAGTAMPTFKDLSESERWSLAFYVGQLAVSPTERQAAPLGDPGELGQLGLFTTLSPAEARTRFGADGEGQLAWQRAHPDGLFTAQRVDPLEFSLNTLQRSLAAYRKGDAKDAYGLAIRAYLEGFELVENNLDAVDSGLRHRVENAMTAYRILVRRQAPVGQVAAQAGQARTLLEEAQGRLRRETLSGGAAFASALVILLREGLEALLVVAALAAYLIRTGRRDGLAWLYGGLVGALALGGLTWLASVTFLDIGGAGRELTEGLAALLAAGVLFYVGFWMHGKTGAAQWKRFIDGNMQKALGQGALWGVAGLSFIAVYREVFEVVLFYQALWIQTAPGEQPMLLYGLASATALLLVLAWLILRFSARLPLRQFFSVTSSFMLVLAVIFAGKGIAALQEAGKLPISPVNMPSLDLLGIYANWEGLLAQGALILVAAVLLYRSRQGAA